MSKQQREHVSALADGELDPDLIGPTISALEANADLKARWERYGLVGAALRGEPVSMEYRGIAVRVRAQLATEPVPLLAPLKAGQTPHRGRRQDTRSRRGAYAGMALAASAAFLVVYALPPLFSSRPATQPAPALAQVSAPGSTARPLAPVAAVKPGEATPRLVRLEPTPVKGAAPRWHAAEPKLQPKLDQLLLNHQASSPTSGIKGLFPYATVVGYEAGR